MIRLATLTAVTMVAFAANSLLNRMALDDGQTGPAAFALIRVASGALCLWLLVKGVNVEAWERAARLRGAS